jgi:flagellar basal-body rod modification protein FlgD
LTVSAVESPLGPFRGNAVTNTADKATTTTSTSDDKDLFLQLLVAQMRYQDPSNPTDSSEFLAQTAQFTALEKMQAVADQTQQLVAVQTAFGAGGMVGQTVSYADAAGATLTGVVSGVRFDATGPILTVDGTDVPLGMVKSIGEANSAPAGSTTSGTGGSTTGSGAGSGGTGAGTGAGQSRGSSPSSDANLTPALRELLD